MKHLKYIVTLLAFISFFTSCSNEGANESDSETSEMKFIDPANMDLSVRPQDDFFRYANGAWLDSNDIPASKSSWGSFNILAENNRENLRTIVETAANDESAEEGSITKKVGDFYKSGMDTLKIDELGINPVQSELDMIDAISSLQELINVTAELRRTTVSSMFSMYVSQDVKNPEEYILYFRQGGLRLPDRDYYFKTEDKFKTIQEEYQQHIANMLVFTGHDEESAKSAALRVYELEKTLAGSSRQRKDLRDTEKNYNKMKLSEFDESFSNIEWTAFLSKVGMPEVEDVIVGQPEFFTSLDAALQDIPLEDWKNYLKWNSISDKASFLSSDIEQERFRFYSTVLRGVKEMEPRWKRVLNMVNATMGEAVGQVYVRQFFPPEAKEVALEMINDIQDAFKERIDGLDWMSPETKTKALAKLDNFRKKIGYPDRWKDYSNVKVDVESYLTNVTNASMFEQQRNYNKIGQPIDKEEWFMTPPTVNAYYNPPMNEIVFPAGILQFPFFDFKADAAVNYGGIGAVIGHELTHGFDDQGSKYDATGTLNNWWTDEDREKFESKTQVLVNHYSAFTVLDSMNINGEMTLGENIADLGGLSIAYDALQKYYERNGRPEEIDGFTGEQRFFLSWAQVWRIKFTDDALMQRVMTDYHSPGIFRVNGVVSNMPEFYEAFDLNEGDGLYRKSDEMAKIW